MELASRVYDIITQPENVCHDSVRKILPAYGKIEHQYWRRVVRIGALCHDLGHLPFSHAAEKDLLPAGWDHERMTRELIFSDEMQTIWKGMTVPLKPEDIVNVAVGPQKATDYTFSDWEAILSEIIVGNTFGVDRMDYLLRDSLHIGVAYGKFDHYRLVDTLRIFPKGEAETESSEPTLGLQIGGLQSAEALLWARYFMYSQVYFHPVRRIYDIHLQDFLKEWLAGGVFSTNVNEYVALSDNEVLVAIRRAAGDKKCPGHIHARRIIEHNHFKLLYERNPDDQAINPDSANTVFEAASTKYGPECIRCSSYTQKGGSEQFPVLLKNEKILQSVQLSDTLRSVPIVATDHIFIKPELFEEAQKWLETNREIIIRPQVENQE